MNDNCVNFVDPAWGSGAVWLACPGWGDPMAIPVPWFGGKRRAASLIWERFGPALPRVATGNDLNGFVANFFRAVAGDPEAVARAAESICTRSTSGSSPMLRGFGSDSTATPTTSMRCAPAVGRGVRVRG